MINVIRKKGINPVTKALLWWIQWTRVSTTVETSLAKRMARGGTYSVGEASGVLLDFPQFIVDELLNGNAVKVAGLGEFKLRVQAKADADPEKVSTRGAKVSVVFEADKELTSRLNNEAEFKIVTTPTPEGQSDADNAEVPTENEGEGNANDNENENGGGNGTNDNENENGGNGSNENENENENQNQGGDNGGNGDNGGDDLEG